MPDSRPRGGATSTIAIIGAGALGSVFASALLQAGNAVTLIGRSPTPDITVCEPPCVVHQTTLPVATDPGLIGNSEFVFMLVKAYDTETATRSVAPHLHPDATVVTLQNGLGNAERIRAHLAATHRVLTGVTSQAARRVSRGLVMHTGAGPTVIGYESLGDRTAADRAVAILGNAGLPATVTGDIYRFVWQKVAVNAAINGLTAVARVPNGAVLARASLSAAADALAEEAASVASAHGYDITGIQHTLRETVLATAENRSSMLQDIEVGRRTEVDAIYGSLIAAGQERGLALPALTVMDALVRAVSSQNGDEEIQR